MESLTEALQSSSIQPSGEQLQSLSGSSDWLLPNYDLTTSTIPSVEDEAKRLITLKSYQILDSGREREFDRLTAQIRQRMNATCAILAFVDLGRVWIKSMSGESLDLSQMARRDAFCAHTVMQKDGLLVVDDLGNDVRFRDNKLVKESPSFRFHAGAPLTSPEGYNIGSICVLDIKPRPGSLSQMERKILESMAAEAVKLLVSRKNKLEGESKRDRSRSFVLLDTPSSPTMKRVRSNNQLSENPELLEIPVPLSKEHQAVVTRTPQKCSFRLLIDSSPEKGKAVQECIEEPPAIIRKPILDPILPDPTKSDSDPDQYLSELLKAQYGISPKVTPALKLEGYFPTISEAQMAAYSMDVVSATRENNTEKIRALVQERGPECLDCYNRFGEGLLNMACRRGFQEMVQFLLSPEVQLSVRVRDDYGRTPLHDACWHPEPQLDICSWILEIDPSLFLIADKRGFTPFQYARKSDWPIWRQFLYDKRERLEALVQPEILNKFS